MANRIPLPKGFSSWTNEEKVIYILSSPDVSLMCSTLEKSNMCSLAYTEFHAIATSPSVLEAVGASCKHQLLMAQPAVTRATIEYAVSSLRASSDRKLLIQLAQPKDGEGGADLDVTSVLKELLSESDDKDFVS